MGDYRGGIMPKPQVQPNAPGSGEAGLEIGSTVPHMIGLVVVMLLLLAATPYVVRGVIALFHAASIISVGLLATAGIAYGTLWSVGTSLDKKFEGVLASSLAGETGKPSPPPRLTRTYGMLLVCLLPFLLFLFLLALYLVEVLVTEVLIFSDAIGGMPIVVLMGLGILALGTIWGVMIGVWRLFVAPKAKDVGIAIARDTNRHLWDVVDQVATDSETRTAATIYLTPDAEIAVWEQGGMARILIGRGTRCMRIGMGAIHDMDVAELKAILRHEFAHFGNRDTAWGSFTFSMTRALHTAWRATPGGNPFRQRSILGVVICMNPAWWVYWLFVRLFYRATGGFSRLREVMADWDAITYSGGAAFASGLTKAIVNGEALDRWKKSRKLQKGEIPRVADEVAALISAMSTEESAHMTESALDRPMSKTSVYETHPAPHVRLAYAKQAKCEGVGCDEGLARTLLDDWQALDGEVSHNWLKALALA